MKTRRTTKRVAALLLALIMTAMMATPFMAKAEGNAGDNIDKTGVMQIFVYHEDSKTGDKYFIQSGSGFLINDSDEGTQYVITCDHVAEVSDEDAYYIKEALDIDKLNIKIDVVVTGDVTQSATLEKASATDDFAILKLAAPIHEKNAMVLRSEEINQTEDVYAMGYPGAITGLKDFEYYTEDDVTVSKGSVSLTEMDINGVPYIQHSAMMTDGCSGGPLVDENGYVVGLNTSVLTLDNGSYYYSLRISEVTNVLDMLGISYQTPTGTTSPSEVTSESPDTTDTEGDTSTDVSTEGTTEVTTEAVSYDSLNVAINEANGAIESDYTEESYANLKDALVEANSIKADATADQAAVDAATSKLKAAYNDLEEASSNRMLIIIIVAAVVLIAVIVIIIVAVSKSGKKKQASNSYSSAPTPTPVPQNRAGLYPPQSQPQSPVPPVPPVAPQAPSVPRAPQSPVQSASQAAAAVQGEGAGETSVLGYGTGETTVLGGTNQMKASLTRVKTNEKVDIVKQIFRVGKERNKVDYCITNNNSVSRVHADIIFKNGQYYIMDNNSTNYTFVNGQMIPAKQEVQLSDGDRIKFAEEEFLFKLS